jgi:Gnt-I system high-affinity gluconate transporter
MFYSVGFVILIPLVFTMVLFIIAGTGTLKQVLADSGLSDYIAGLLKGSAVSLLLLAWGITAIIK